MADERLHVFISYSSEDRDLATAIAEELRRAFNPTILKLTIDVEFSLGSNWRDRLKANLDDTDILLVVATGKQKVSHSFTGFEVGYFDASISHSPKMEHFPTQDRIMIPIAVFTKTPETMSDIEALNINAPFDPMVVDPAALKNPASPTGAANVAMKKTPIFRLFKRIQGIINQSILLSDEDLEAVNTQLLEASGRLFNIIHLELQKRVYQENFPERKIVVRTSLAAASPGRGDALSDATVEFFGRFEFVRISDAARGASSLVPVRREYRRGRHRPLLDFHHSNAGVGGHARRFPGQPAGRHLAGKGPRVQNVCCAKRHLLQRRARISHLHRRDQVQGLR